ncbi:hypothetical protein Tco_0461373 [Tanacetum coccineum]
MSPPYLGNYNIVPGGLANEYELRIGKKGYILDYIWEKCERVHGGTVILQYDQGFEEEEQWECCFENAYYDPPEFNVEIFIVKRYSFENGRGFVYDQDVD